ncbi:MAG: CoA-binding protein [Deltaproteobacteria bacterium]|nr:CoA-binding protein [Deltaproteobacteria bacterium]
MSETIVEQLDHIFKPKSVAIIGASGIVEKWGGRLLQRALNSNFRGNIYPVNPKVKELMGVKAYADVRDIPGEVEMAVFTVTAAQMPAMMKACVEKGVRGGVIISADFAETGETGKKLEEETVRIARAGNLRFVGPNCNGIWCSASNLNMTPAESRMSGPVAFISQSGSFGGIAGRITLSRGYGLSKFIAIGNQGDLTATDYLEYLSHDDDTKVITMYMEGFKDGQRFFDVAREVAARKPILLMKGGRSDVGARATMSHTASIAGSDEVFDAICRQAGIIRVHQMDHLFIMAEPLFSQPLPKGKRVGVLANGGEGVVACDNLIALGMEVPEFTKEDSQRLKAMLPPHAPNPRNPVDFAAGNFDSAAEVKVFDALASLDSVDAILTLVPRDRSYKETYAERRKDVIDAVNAFGEIPGKYGKPMIGLFWRHLEVIDDALKQYNIPQFDNVEQASLAMAALVKYGEIKRRLSQ